MTVQEQEIESLEQTGIVQDARSTMFRHQKEDKGNDRQRKQNTIDESKPGEFLNPQRPKRIQDQEKKSNP